MDTSPRAARPSASGPLPATPVAARSAAATLPEAWALADERLGRWIRARRLILIPVGVLLVLRLIGRPPYAEQLLWLLALALPAWGIAHVLVDRARSQRVGLEIAQLHLADKGLLADDAIAHLRRVARRHLVRSALPFGFLRWSTFLLLLFWAVPGTAVLALAGLRPPRWALELWPPALLLALVGTAFAVMAAREFRFDPDGRALLAQLRAHRGRRPQGQLYREDVALFRRWLAGTPGLPRGARHAGAWILAAVVGLPLLAGATVVVPTAISLHCRSQQAEPKTVLRSVHVAESAYFAEHGRYADRAGLESSGPGFRLKRYELHIEARADGYRARAVTQDTPHHDADVWTVDQTGKIDNTRNRCR